MADLFGIRRQMDGASGDLVEARRAKRADAVDAERERAKRLIRLKVGVYFDPVTREILRKVGSQFVFIRHDRRKTQRNGLSAEEAERGQLRLIQGGLFWDPKENVIYQFRSGRYLLYSRDRRKQSAGKSPTGVERRRR